MLNTKGFIVASIISIFAFHSVGSAEKKEQKSGLNAQIVSESWIDQNHYRIDYKIENNDKEHYREVDVEVQFKDQDGVLIDTAADDHHRDKTYRAGTVRARSVVVYIEPMTPASRALRGVHSIGLRVVKKRVI